ncbi:CBS domain-containing protein [Ahrensia marina]|uniref:CBS domain-containing protein n=1 Tax=Ahrensia marina TaxID=1514904 RepID=UPI0035D0E922
MSRADALPLVADFMSRDLVTLTPQMEINRAMTILLERKISGAPVLDSDSFLVGVLTKRDCLKAALDASYYRDWGGRVDAYMSHPVMTIEASMDIIRATNLFIEKPYRRFPVMEGGKLVGQLSRTDALRALAGQWG